MPPKKQAAPAAVAPPVDLIKEEEEEGEGRAAFRLSIEGVADLPCPLETCIAFSGICNDNRSSPAPASENPTEFELKKDKFIRSLGQELFDDLVSKDLVITLRDAGADGAEIGRATLSCLPLLHENLEVGGKLELKLTETYHKKWWPELVEAAPVDPKAKAKAKAAPAPPAEVQQERPKRPADFVPPTTTVTIRVTVDALVGPEEDRDDWTTLSVDFGGAFALPERLLGETGPAATPEDLEAHPYTYKAMFLGESLGSGKLAKPREEEPPPPEPPAAGEEGEGGAEAEAEAEAEAQPEEELSEEEKREKQERFGLRLAFGDEKPVVRYRGKSFLREFRYMLNFTGGAWLYLALEEKPSTDPKKPNPPEVGALSKHFAGKAWVDLRPLVRPGTRSMAGRCNFVSAAPAEDVLPEEPSLADAGAFVRLAFALRADAVPPPEPPVDNLRGLVPPRAKMNRFPSSIDATAMYHEVVESTLTTICRDARADSKGVAGVVEQMKKAGSYDDLKDSLRAALIQVCRERLRKDTGAVPGRRLEGAARDEAIASTYAYLMSDAAKVLDELRGPSSPDGIPPTPSRGATMSGVEGEMSPPGGGAEALDASGGAASMSVGGDLADMESVQMGDMTSAISATPHAAPALNPTELLAEFPAARRARSAVLAASEVGGRSARLAFEAELVGNWSRAAELLQQRLLLEEVNSDPKEWVAYAKFCARARGRQAAAEEALRQAVQLLAEQGPEGLREDAVEVDTMLACLLLDRGRQEEATRVLRELHEKDLADPVGNFLLALALFLAEEEPAVSSALFTAVGKPREWFQGMTSDQDIVKKVKSAKLGDVTLDAENYAMCLEKLLDFGLPSLVFTFLDQAQVLPLSVTNNEPLALIDAKASALDRDYHAAVERLEQLVLAGGVIPAPPGSPAHSIDSGGGGPSAAAAAAAQGGASREAWRLLGDCYYHIGDMDRSWQALNQALSFDRKYEEPGVFMRLGMVLIAKKRWKQAREAFLKSIQLLPTAEAWAGAAYAEYRSDELQPCYEALCEATLLDKERADIWALSTLVHLRLDNGSQADHAFRQCLSLQATCEELLVEVATEYAKCAKDEKQVSLAEAAARRALELRDSSAGHSALADALAAAGRLAEAVAEAVAAMGLLVHSPELRGPICDRALKWCEELNDPAVAESLYAAQRRCDEDASQALNASAMAAESATAPAS